MNHIKIHKLNIEYVILKLKIQFSFIQTSSYTHPSDPTIKLRGDKKQEENNKNLFEDNRELLKSIQTVYRNRDSKNDNTTISHIHIFIIYTSIPLNSKITWC